MKTEIHSRLHIHLFLLSPTVCNEETRILRHQAVINHRLTGDLAHTEPLRMVVRSRELCKSPHLMWLQDLSKCEKSGLFGCSIGMQYFHTQWQFLKIPWVCTLLFFIHFLSLSLISTPSVIIGCAVDLRFCNQSSVKWLNALPSAPIQLDPV